LLLSFQERDEHITIASCAKVAAARTTTTTRTGTEARTAA